MGKGEGGGGTTPAGLPDHRQGTISSHHRNFSAPSPCQAVSPSMPVVEYIRAHEQL